jgi:hypothetical protein
MFPHQKEFINALVDGRHLYVSGHVSINTDGSYISGKLGKDLNEEEGRMRPGNVGWPYWHL